jgi:hypothetical protein
VAGFEAKQKEIAGKKFTVSPLPFGRGKAGLLRLLGVIAPSIGDVLARGASVTSLLSDARGAAFIGNALAGLPHRLDENTMAWFENEFGSKSKAEVGDVNVEMKLDNQAARDTVFESLGYMAFFEWLAFCLEVNYSNFFSEALAGLGSRKPKATAEK